MMLMAFHNWNNYKSNLEISSTWDLYETPLRSTELYDVVGNIGNQIRCISHAFNTQLKKSEIMNDTFDPRNV